jgi:hypothetical protein
MVPRVAALPAKPNAVVQQVISILLRLEAISRYLASQVFFVDFPFVPSASLSVHVPLTVSLSHFIFPYMPSTVN